jgi:hypothetical protein
MALDLLAIEPNKVSTDLSGYITYIYGEGKTGKTTMASKMKNALLLAFEPGYKAIPGIRAQDITSWAQVKQVQRQLRDPKVKEAYKSIVVDTVDIAAALCEKYVCSQAGVERLNDVPYGQGWTKVKKEFEETFRAIAQDGYALFFISHSKDKVFKAKDGTEYNQIVPSCPTTYNEIVKNMADIYAFAEKYLDEAGENRVRLNLRSPDNRADTGCRFKYIVNTINFEYSDLVKALEDAIETEAQMTNNASLFTDEKVKAVEVANYDYDALMAEFQSIVSTLMEKDNNFYTPRITQIVDKYLGKGKKVSEATRDQAEFIFLIIAEMKEELL